MAAASTTPQQAAVTAANTLAPHREHPAIAAVLSTLKAIGSDADGDDDRVEKALLRSEHSMSELRKCEGEPGVQVALEKLEGAHKHLQLAHLAAHSGGYDTSTRALAEAGRLPA